ncbi:MAG: SDR family oxidoreductase [Proteobacteria bacterium]|nr:SDR family oxidoreductase [Pseudomonadota bacterium]
MKNIFITGVSGYLGGRIAQALSENENVSSIVGIDIQPPKKNISKLTFFKKDVRDPISDLLKDHHIDTVIHAAYVLTPIHDRSLMEDMNISGMKNVLKACAENKISHLLYTSSATAYGFHPDNPVPLNETHPLRGNDDFTYAKNKKEIEAIIGEFTKAHPEIKISVLRPCFVVGPHFDNPLSRHLTRRWVLFPSPVAPFQFVHEDDLVRAVLLCLEKTITGVFNIAGEGTVSLPEAVDMLGGTSFQIPYWIMSPLTKIAWGLHLKFIAESPASGLNMLRYPWIVTTNRFTEEAGFEYQYSSRTAFEDFVRSVK